MESWRRPIPRHYRDLLTNPPAPTPVHAWSQEARSTPDPRFTRPCSDARVRSIRRRPRLRAPPPPPPRAAATALACRGASTASASSRRRRGASAPTRGAGRRRADDVPRRAADSPAPPPPPPRAAAADVRTLHLHC
ncbi:hypothetical protein BS78_01G093700 [Paspalum vaginatum]|nr:hypothetical protein BS78_01G093700 [Paspalum vaginatum]